MPDTRDHLFDVQKEALIRAGRKAGFCYFMEQGLGKTLTAIHEFHEKAMADDVDMMFVVCGRTMRGGWRDEVIERGYPYPVHLVKDENTAYNWIKEQKKAGRRRYIIICHYELMLTRGDEILKALIDDRRRVFLVADESIRIASHSSKTSERMWLTSNGLRKVKVGRKTEIQKTGTRAKYIRAMTGTPSPEGPHQLWAQFRFIGEIVGYAYFAWRNTFCKMGGFENKKILGAQNLDILAERTRRFVFRAEKKDWTDLPEKLWERPREIDMTKAQKEAYQSMKRELVLEMGEEIISVEMAVAAKTKLQQISSGWVYNNEKVPVEIVPIKENPKILELISVLQGNRTKILVFYHFRETRNVLAAAAAEWNIEHVFMESGLSDNEFDTRKKKFNDDENIQVAFCQIAACKEGLTLLGTASRPCYTTIFFENSYSYYSRAQAEDRNHRHGQKNVVTYVDFTTSREDKDIIRALQTKKGLQEAVTNEFKAVPVSADDDYRF